MSALRLGRRGDRGASAVEFALVTPLLILLVFGMIDFGFAINRYAQVNNAAREGVREASLKAPAADVTNAVNNSADGLGTLSVTLTCVKKDNTACGTWASAESGGTASVKVTYSANWLTPVGRMFSPRLNIEKVTKMRIE